MPQTKTLWLAFAFLICAGCAHYHLPAGNLESPETLGPDRVARLELMAIQTGTDLVGVASEQSTDPETGKTPDPVLPMMMNYSFGATVGVRPDLELGIRIQPHAPTSLRAKYQFYGEPESKASRGNLSAAVSGLAGLLLGTYEGSSVTFFHTQGALIGGWRFATRHLASLSPFLSFANISGVDPSSGSGNRFGATLGYQYDAESLVARAELTWLTGTMSQTSGPVSFGSWFPGAQLGFRL